MPEQTYIPKLLFTKPEAAAAIGYKPRALDYAISSGDLPVVRHGARVFITRDALEAFARQDRPRIVPKAVPKGNEPAPSAEATSLRLAAESEEHQTQAESVATHEDQPLPPAFTMQTDYRRQEEERKRRRRRNCVDA